MDVLVTSSQKWLTSSPPDPCISDVMVTSSQKWRTSSPPATFVRNRVLYVKFMPNIQRAQRALSPCRSKNHQQNHIQGSHPCKFQRTSHISAHLSHIQGSHPRKIQRLVTSGGHIQESHPDKIQSLPGGNGGIEPYS